MAAEPQLFKVIRDRSQESRAWELGCSGTRALQDFEELLDGCPGVWPSFANRRDKGASWLLAPASLFQPDFDPSVLLSTFFGFVGSDRQRLPITGRKR